MTFRNQSFAKEQWVRHLVRVRIENYWISSNKSSNSIPGCGLRTENWKKEQEFELARYLFGMNTER
jgi:hypothetical protein